MTRRRPRLAPGTWAQARLGAETEFSSYLLTFSYRDTPILIDSEATRRFVAQLARYDAIAAAARDRRGVGFR